MICATPGKRPDFGTSKDDATHKRVKTEALEATSAKSAVESTHPTLATARDGAEEKTAQMAQLPAGKKWEHFEHNGVVFPDNWQRHHVPIAYAGETLALDDFQEEVATYWAQGLFGDWEHKPFYRDNFARFFVASFDPELPALKRHFPLDFDKFDFRPIHEHLQAEKQKREELTSEQKQAAKERREREEAQYRHIIIDDRLEKVANFKIEPPTLFKGRGEHPKAGSLKQRIAPEDVELNLSKTAMVPICHLPGRCWGGVAFQNDASWVASYLEGCTGTRKYVLLSASSKIKSANDLRKYERARRLKDHIERIRDDYRAKMREDSARDRQLGTAAYLIDFLAIRVGNEKKEDEADTVGCCSLRIEHLRVEEEGKITLDFLGKDSMRYQNTVQIDPIAHANLAHFVRGKKPEQEVFDAINSSRLNEYLHSLMEDLTAKVFRTFNASKTLQAELDKSSLVISPADPLDKKLEFYNEANRQVALLCNHQKGVSKTFDVSIEKQTEKLEELQQELKKVQKEKGAKSLQAERLKERVAKMEKAIEMRHKNKSIALSTSKINYNDPRISVAWCKQYEVPIEKIFTTVLLEKFVWAMDCASTWKF